MVTDIEKWVRDECRKKAVWLAEIKGQLAGVMVMDVAEIFYLVTTPGYRRRGVARALIRHAIAMIFKRYRCG
ncbi:MAG TPA: GNAT family N-acetyltransferase [Rhizomicrobium sp.]|jgi:ribosomal protein S18 acetylase RimI-like enzyme|nr:GNAT family N-acetyltransferase [Rhizomicrobium sp.]